MAILTIDLRSGRSDERLRTLAAGLMDAVSKLTGEPREDVVLVIHVGGSPHVVEIGERLLDSTGVRTDV